MVLIYQTPGLCKFLAEIPHRCKYEGEQQVPTKNEMKIYWHSSLHRLTGLLVGRNSRAREIEINFSSLSLQDLAPHLWRKIIPAIKNM